MGNKNGEKLSAIMNDINLLIEAARSGNTDSVYHLMKKIVPQYREGEYPAVTLNGPKTPEELEIPLQGTAAPAPVNTKEPK